MANCWIHDHPRAQTGVWEVRAFGDRDALGRPIHTSRTVRGAKRDAMRLAASFDS